MKWLVILFVTTWTLLQTESKKIVTRSVDALALSNLKINSDYVPNYHWREYHGLVPTDAIPGGLTKTGETTYIGQFSLKSEYETTSSLVTVPANIFKRSTTAVSSYNAKIRNSTHDSNTKILCSPFPNRYKWYSPTVHIPPRCHIIVGGLEDTIPLIIGRAVVDGQIVIGKIFSNERHDFNIIVPDVSNKKELILDTYEVLTYCY